MCLNYLRKAHRSLNRLPSLTSSGILRRLEWLEWCVKPIGLLPRTYAELLVSGGYLRPILAMVGWPLGVAIVCWRPIRKLVGWGLPLSLGVALGMGDIAVSDTAATTWKRIASRFFEAAVAPEKSVNLSENIFGLIIVMIGVFHIGVFISFVFSRLMRR